MYTIDEDVKTHQFHRCYLLFGPEAYLIRQYRDKLRKAAFPEKDDMNLSVLSGNTQTVESVIDLSETLPFFADLRFIIWEDSGLFGPTGEKMAQYLPDVPETTVFIFVEKEVDKRSKLYKTVRDLGHAAEFQPVGEDRLKQWILQIVTKEKKKITYGAIDLLLDRTGTDMSSIRMELEKLLCYCMDKPAIEASDVEAICSMQVIGRIFDMISAMANKRQKETLDLYYDLLAAKEPPMKILVLLGRQFSQMLAIKELREKGFDKRRITQKTEMKDFLVDKYMTQAAKFDKATLYMAFRDCVEADEAVKSGKMTDRLCVETLLVKYSSQNE